MNSVNKTNTSYLMHYKHVQLGQANGGAIYKSYSFIYPLFLSAGITDSVVDTE